MEDQTEPIEPLDTPPVPNQSAAEAASAASDVKPRKRLWPLSRTAVGVGAGVLGLLIGAACVGLPAMIASRSSSAEMAGLSQERDTLQNDLKNAKSSLQTSESQLKTAKSALDELKGRVGDLDAREAAVAQREGAAKAAEQVIAANSFGEGVRIVGQNTAAGTYTTGEITSGMCYYVWKTSTAADAEIVDNNIVKSGTATVTLRDGEVFESNRCGKWTKVG